MSKIPPKQKKQKNISREELLTFDKNDLVDKIIQLEAHNAQLKNIISKNLPSDENNQSESNTRQFDFSKCHYRRVLLRILYFGWDYNGLAVQEDSTKTIEHHLFHALVKSCLIEKRETSNYHRCGRTDKGVSSFGQVISISLRSKYPPEQQHTPKSISSELQYCKILNRLFPKEIKAVAWTPIPDDKPEYSARFDCKMRTYKYYFPRSSLNIEAMRNACRHLVGAHDYRNLCKMDVANGVTEFTREIFTADILPVGTESASPTAMYYLLIEGNAFLWHQIRCIMGVLLLVGRGDEEPDVVRELLDVETNPRKPQYNMASDIPLNLFHCAYELEQAQDWVYDREELRTVIGQLQMEWTGYNIKATMIIESLNELEKTYSNLRASEKGVESSESKEDRVICYSNCLLQGVQQRVYKPLMKRVTCSSLEERIEHYKKKRKLEDVSVNNE